MISYKIFDGPLPDEWDLFVNAHPEGRYGHLSGLKAVLQSAYCISGPYIGIYEDGVLRGIFPCVTISQFTGKKKLVSMPYVDLGGFLLAEGFTPPRHIVKEALSTCLTKAGADFLIIRGPSHFGGDFDNSLFHEVKDCQFATLPLGSLGDVVARYDRTVRQNVNQARSYGLTVLFPEDADFISKIFYSLYSITMKEFGTPPHSLQFFLAMHDILKDRLRVFAVMQKDVLLSALVAVRSSSRLHLGFFVSRKDARRLRPNELLMSELIAWACQNGYTALDMGPVRHEGQRHFKTKWGARLADYNYYFFPEGINPSLIKTYSNPDLFNRIWAACVPEPLSRRLGPFIRKKVGR